MARMNEDDHYDMVKEFLVEGAKRPAKKSRPALVEQVLRSLNESAPEHARVIEQYLRALEDR